jgi:bifunctional DNA-binding transcriptional regulator/antitoxin component of YhaV-PrlF toxin-antitoxin module
MPKGGQTMGDTATMSDAEARIGNRYQVTVPKAVLNKFSLREGDFLKWTIVKGNIQVTPMRLTKIQILSDAEVLRMEAELRDEIASGKTVQIGARGLDANSDKG